MKKTTLPRRLLSMMLALALVFCLLPVSAFAAGDAGTAKIAVSYQAGGAFALPKQTVTVTADLSELYGYKDHTAGVSALDALIRAHQLYYTAVMESYDEETFKEWIPLALTVNDSGFITKMFEKETSSVSFAVNGLMPVDKSKAPLPAGNGYPESYVGYTIADAPIVSGDDVEFFAYQDTSCLDYYTWLESAGSRVTDIEAVANRAVSFKLKGYFYAYYGMTVQESFRSGDAMAQSVDFKSISAVLLDPKSGASGDKAITASAIDENGSFTVTFPQEGTYVLSVSGGTTALVAPWCVVRVGSAPDPTPVLTVTAEDGGAIPDGGYRYAADAPAAPIKVNVGNSSEGGAYTYAWKRVSESGSYMGTAEGTNNQASYTPSTAKDGVQRYYCQVTFTLDGVKYQADTKAAPVAVAVTASSARQPQISAQPKSAEYLAGTVPAELSVTATAADGGKLSYQWYQSADNSSFSPVDGAETKSFVPQTSAVPATAYYRCKVINTLSSISGETYRAELDSDAAVLSFKSAADLGGGWKGQGTRDNPFLIESIEDLTALQTLVNTKGIGFEGYCFRLMQDISLPADWVPIGALKTGQRFPASGKNIWPFSGNLDGGGHTVTVAEDGLPLFGYVRWASVKNLNIYGTKIAGYGLVNNYCVDYGPTGSYGSCSHAVIDIENVTLKSGTSTKMAGFIGGFASALNTVNIRGCKAEQGVTIGYTKDQYKIGTFAGTLAGTMENCVSYADVYGVSSVGGLAGSKGEAMGPCAVRDSAFCGTVTATEEYAGGIMGSGYGSASAPNTPCVTIQNCYVSGTVTGTDRVGGIFGGEPASKQCWANGIGYIENNSFTGTIKAAGENVGGVIGFMNSLDRYNVIENNFYQEGCGAAKGIGKVNAANVDLTSEKYGRNDDPTGAGAQKLGKAASAQAFADGTVTAALNGGKNSSGNWQQGTLSPVFGNKVHLVELAVTAYQDRYEGGADFDLAALKVTARYSDGTVRELNPADVIISGFSSQKTGYKTLSAAYSGHYCLIEIFVTSDAAPSADTIKVRFTLLGDGAHGENGDTHTLRSRNLVTWIPAQSVTVPKNATVLDAFEEVLNAAGASFGNRGGNYIYSITYQGVTLEEFTNGPKSGWMYTLNGRHPLLGVSEQQLKDGDVVIFHYTDDYTKEEGSDKWNPPVTSEPSSVMTPDAAVKNGAASAAVTADQLNAAVKAAEKQGERVVVIAPKVSGDADRLSLSLPTAAMNTAAAAGTSLRLDTDIGSVELSKDALKTAAGKASSGTVEITVARKTGAELKDKTINAEGAVIAEITLTSGGKAITSFGGEPLLIDLRVGKGYEEGALYKVVVISADGTTETLACKCVKKDGKLSVAVRIPHLSTFVVTTEKAVVFADVAGGAWYADCVAAAANSGLMTGTGKDLFSPEVKMTRAMLVTTLYRLAGAPAVNGGAGFTDTQTGAWYSDAISWAVQNKIAEGYGGGRFGANDEVTREQFVTMLLRFAQYKKYTAAGSAPLDGFKDADSVSGWALSAMKWAAAEKLITGRTPDTLAPCGSATRAEAAAILTRFAVRFH